MSKELKKALFLVKLDFLVWILLFLDDGGGGNLCCCVNLVAPVTVKPGQSF